MQTINTVYKALPHLHTDKTKFLTHAKNNRKDSKLHFISMSAFITAVFNQLTALLSASLRPQLGSSKFHHWQDVLTMQFMVCQQSARHSYSSVVALMYTNDVSQTMNINN